jgi:hypothetical protein
MGEHHGSHGCSMFMKFLGTDLSFHEAYRGARKEWLHSVACERLSFACGQRLGRVMGRTWSPGAAAGSANGLAHPL